MRAIPAIIGLALLAACAGPGQDGGPQHAPAQTEAHVIERAEEGELGLETAGGRPSIAKKHERSTLDLLEGVILDQVPNYEAVDPKTGEVYRIRFYVEHHSGHDHEIAIVSLEDEGGERLANYTEYRRAIALKQAELRDRGDAIDRIMTNYYSADRLRQVSGLDDRIKFQEGAIRELEGEMRRLSRQIKAWEEVPDGADQNQISVWIKQYYERKVRREAMLLQVQEMKYLRALREQEAEDLSRPARQ